MIWEKFDSGMLSVAKKNTSFESNLFTNHFVLAEWKPSDKQSEKGVWIGPCYKMKIMTWLGLKWRMYLQKWKWNGLHELEETMEWPG